MRETQGIIKFENSDQIALWNHELVGQISDGMWENARPVEHWVFWGRCDTELSPLKPGVLRTGYKYPLKNNYNFNSKELIDIIGDRMRAYVVMSRITNDDDLIHVADYIVEDDLRTMEDVFKFVKKDEYYRKKMMSVTQGLLDRFWAEYERFQEKDLRKILKRIKEIIKIDLGRDEV